MILHLESVRAIATHPQGKFALVYSACRQYPGLMTNFGMAGIMAIARDDHERIAHEPYDDSRFSRPPPMC